MACNDTVQHFSNMAKHSLQFYMVRYNNIFAINICDCHFNTNHHQTSWMQLKSQWLGRILHLQMQRNKNFPSSFACLAHFDWLKCNINRISKYVHTRYDLIIFVLTLITKWISNRNDAYRSVLSAVVVVVVYHLTLWLEHLIIL